MRQWVKFKSNSLLGIKADVHVTFSVFIIRENFLEVILVARTQETIPFYTIEMRSIQ